MLFYVLRSTFFLANAKETVIKEHRCNYGLIKTKTNSVLQIANAKSFCAEVISKRHVRATFLTEQCEIKPDYVA